MIDVATDASPVEARELRTRSHPRIVVIGGAGATGAIIVAALRRVLPNATIVVASRSAWEQPRPPEADGAIPLDAACDLPQPAGITALAGFDLAVLALGPFDAVLDRAHRLCIAAGVDCLDINDSPEASRAILALDPVASSAKVTVLTGMGLNPGLSTLLLDDLVASLQQVERIEVRLFAGGNEPSGVAATRTMIANFRPHVLEFRNGRETSVAADDVSTQRAFAYPTIPGSLVSIHCSSAESALLEARGDAAPKAHIDYRIHFQGMPPGLVGVFRRSPFLRSPRAARGLARFFHTMHGRSRQRSGNLDRSVMAVRAVGTTSDGIACARTAFATGATTFGMTAAFAAVVAKAHLRGETGTTAGVLAIGLRTALSHQALIGSLQATGIEIRHVEG
jgi:hypothetical protein